MQSGNIEVAISISLLYCAVHCHRVAEVRSVRGAIL